MSSNVSMAAAQAPDFRGFIPPGRADKRRNARASSPRAIHARGDNIGIQTFISSPSTEERKISSTGLDSNSATVYWLKMVRLTRVFVFALLIAFTVGSVAHAASATAMSLKMALAGGSAMNMADCHGCASDHGGDDGGPGCDVICIAPFMGSLAPEGSVPMVAVTSPAARALYDHGGRTGLPEPYPPPTLI